MAHTSIRIGIGRFTTQRECDYFLSLLERSVSVRLVRIICINDSLWF
jgi:cysteine sulfinate desulfinase/cysteine desulfurase-like protein